MDNDGCAAGAVDSTSPAQIASTLVCSSNPVFWLSWRLLSVVFFLVCVYIRSSGAVLFVVVHMGRLLIGV